MWEGRARVCVRVSECVRESAREGGAQKFLHAYNTAYPSLENGRI